jgi:hypothetical protein
MVLENKKKSSYMENPQELVKKRGTCKSKKEKVIALTNVVISLCTTISYLFQLLKPPGMRALAKIL